MIKSITIQTAHLNEILKGINADIPNESCGLIAGKGHSSVKVFPILNILQSPVRYQMDPEKQIRALIEIEDEGLDLLAIYHSHPNGPAVPSPPDIAEAMYPDSVYLIFSPGKKKWISRGFIINREDVREVQIIVK